MSDGSKINISRLLKLTGTAEYHKDFQNFAVIADCYNFLFNGQKYTINHWNDNLYNWDYKNWHAKESDWEPKSMNDGLGWLEIDYENLIYDEAEKAYVYTIIKDGLAGIFSYYFVNGRLVKASAYTYDTENVDEIIKDDYIESIIATFSDIGTTEITVPNYIQNSLN